MRFLLALALAAIGGLAIGVTGGVLVVPTSSSSSCAGGTVAGAGSPEARCRAGLLVPNAPPQAMAGDPGIPGAPSVSPGAHSASPDSDSTSADAHSATPGVASRGGRPAIRIIRANITGYSYFDNTPAGSSLISHPVLHRYAGGSGSYADPITLA